MEETKFTLQSGAKLQVTIASFQEAKNLLKALMKAAAGIPLGANPLDMDVTVLKDALINAATSDEVEQALWVCLDRCLYEGLRITPDLFDNAQMGAKIRKDYFAICAKVVEVNCGPFFEQALSALKGLADKKKSSPPSE